MLNIKDFEKFKLSEIYLTKSSGGETGRETDTCKGTTDIHIDGGPIADESKDGDWNSLC